MKYVNSLTRLARLKKIAIDGLPSMCGFLLNEYNI